MLKDFAYQGAYRNKDMDISFMLENPLVHDITADTLVFKVIIKTRDGDIDAPSLDRFSFYLMDEAATIHKFELVPCWGANAATIKGDDEPQCSCCLIYTGLRPEFLFQDLRIVLYERQYNKLELVRLEY